MSRDFRQKRPETARSMKIQKELSQLLMRAVAERLVAGALAPTQPDFLRLGDGELDRRELGHLVRADAERRALRLPALAPPVVAGGELHRVRPLLRDHRLRPVRLPV